MARRIHILPERLVNQIAAGEVVERPASVVKELVENALDAGATRVEIALRSGGKTEIRVTDDGSGMGREDALLSLDRHATSKIRQGSDLERIHTLGFRGEALPSIASVSRLVLETAERDGEGTRLRVAGGQLDGVEGCARRRGTTVSVRNLFFNVPARAKFLRSTAAETRAASETVSALALAHAGVAFVLSSNERVLLDLPRAPTLAARVAAIWGDGEAGQLMEASLCTDGLTCAGLVQRPHSATPGPRRAYLFVNGRVFSDRHLIRAADRGYRTTVASDVRPSLFLFLRVPDGAVDVNVHPAKAEVRFRDRTAVERLMEEAVRGALAVLDSTPSIGVRPPVASPEYARESAEPRAVREGGVGQMSLFVSASVSPADGSESEPGDGEMREAPTPPRMWQLHGTYILAETRAGLILVDQHSAHERVLYEELMRDFARGEAPGQRLLFPLTVRLSPAEYAVADELLGVLRRGGWEAEAFGDRTLIVQSVPAPHPYFDAERCLREMIAELTDGSPLVDAARNQHQRVALSFACKAAIKAGQRLSDEEMGELFDRLFATELPYHDIHGRPTVIQLSLAELHGRFGRSG